MITRRQLSGMWNYKPFVTLIAVLVVGLLASQYNAISKIGDIENSLNALGQWFILTGAALTVYGVGLNKTEKQQLRAICDTRNLYQFGSKLVKGSAGPSIDDLFPVAKRDLESDIRLFASSMLRASALAEGGLLLLTIGSCVVLTSSSLVVPIRLATVLVIKAF